MLTTGSRAPDVAPRIVDSRGRAAARTGWALQSAIAIPVRAATRHLTRDPSLIAFGAGANRYADNARYAFTGVSRETAVALRVDHR